MSDENRNYPPVPPAPPSAPPQAAPQQQQAAAQQPPQSGARQSWEQTHEKLQQQAGGGAPTWEQIKASGNYQIPSEYPKEKFNPESFSIPAFLLSWIWYMVKGMWQKGVVILVAGIIVVRVVPIVGLLLCIGIAIYAGMYGHRDYMRFHNSKQQFWF